MGEATLLTQPKHGEISKHGYLTLSLKKRQKEQDYGMSWPATVVRPFTVAFSFLIVHLA
jgi:hypothetical protein